MNRQALVLHRYYELLSEAITEYQESGAHFLVTDVGTRAGKVLGEEMVVVSTVRSWHAQYLEGNGVLRPDERGHYTRELLVMEEDVKHKFSKWSLRRAKADDLSVESARDYLNNELLVKLDVCQSLVHQHSTLNISAFAVVDPSPHVLRCALLVHFTRYAVAHASGVPDQTPN